MSIRVNLKLIAQRAILAFTVGFALACADRIARQQASSTTAGATSWPAPAVSSP